MTRLLIAVASLILLVTPIPALSDERVQFAKSLPAKAFDPGLPSVPMEQWLAAQLPAGVVAEWGRSITDCGEQTGDPAIDRQRDIPLCAEIELKRDDLLLGYLLLSVGTGKKGVSREYAGLFSGSVQRKNNPVSLNRLVDLRTLLSAK